MRGKRKTCINPITKGVVGMMTVGETSASTRRWTGVKKLFSETSRCEKGKEEEGRISVTRTLGVVGRGKTISRSKERSRGLQRRQEEENV